MPFEFEPIDLNRQAEYLELYDMCAVKSSDCSFVNLWGWADVYGLEWAWAEKVVWIRQTRPRETFWAPIGDWAAADWEAMFAAHMPPRVSFDRIPETLTRVFTRALGASRVFAVPVRDHWDYLYDADELRRLKGNRFHKKKNLVNQFKKKYEFTYLPLSEQLVDQAAGMQESWCTWRDCQSNEALDAENAAVLKVFDSWRQLERIFGGALAVEGKMIAYTVAEYLSDETLLVHFEKGDPAYKGVYQAINQMFLKESGRGFQFINREQDLGDEGLRKAKLSYLPTDFIRKNRVTIIANADRSAME